MNLIMSGIFVITCYPILLVMYFALQDSAYRNGYCFGASLKNELREDDEVKAIDVWFRKKLKLWTILMAIVPIPFVFIPYFSISMSLWMIWILVICFLPSAFFAVAIIRVRVLKQERGWNDEVSVSYADLKTATVPRKVKLLTFLPSLILSTIPVIIACCTFQG